MSSQNLSSLFTSTPNGLSQQSVGLLIQNLDGAAGLGCVGANVDNLNTDDVTLLSVILDESGSMSAVQSDVIDAFNQMTRALFDSKSRDSILVSAWAFSDRAKLLFNYTPIDQVPDLTFAQYSPHGNTALFDATIDGFTGIVGYGQNLGMSGIRSRRIVVVLSDGADNASKRSSAAVNTIAQDLLKQEIYTLAFIGLGSDPALFQKIASDMGFPALLTASNSASEIRRALKVVSQSVQTLSQGTVSNNNNGFFQP